MKGEAIWKAEGEHKRAAVRDMFADIAPVYDRWNGLVSFRLHGAWRRAAVKELNLKRGHTVLDLCCGTGDFVYPIREAVGQEGAVVGVDFCEPMLRLAAEKGVPAKLSLGDATDLPFGDGRFDGVTVGWGIRNVPDIDRTHREIFRVLKPGGRFVSIDTALPENGAIRAVSVLALGNLLPRMGRLFTKHEAFTYLPQSTMRFWDRKKLTDSMTRAGFTNVGYRSLAMGNLCIHWGTKPLCAESQEAI